MVRDTVNSSFLSKNYLIQYYSIKSKLLMQTTKVIRETT